MHTLIFATNNKHKVEEMHSILQNDFKIISLQEAGIHMEIPEPYDTLEENASEKSSVINKLTGIDCFSEDTGLEVMAINGEPGVKSARYAGEARSFDDNIKLLLHKLNGKVNREAQFRTIISLILEGTEHSFEGICKGSILFSERGNKGFGYDPVFVPEGSEKSFGEMELHEKNLYSHRKKAVEKLAAFLSIL